MINNNNITITQSTLPSQHMCNKTDSEES